MVRQNRSQRAPYSADVGEVEYVASEDELDAAGGGLCGCGGGRCVGRLLVVAPLFESRCNLGRVRCAASIKSQANLERLSRLPL